LGREAMHQLGALHLGQRSVEEAALRSGLERLEVLESAPEKVLAQAHLIRDQVEATANVTGFSFTL
jgi:hypothetical protein